MRRPLIATLFALSVMLALPTAALADPAKPTNYRSQVLGIEPATDLISAEVVGGDSFLRITAEPGTEVVVLGYGEGGRNEEPYIRYEADGAVLVNLRSPAYYLNDARFGSRDAVVPQSATIDAEPAFDPVADGGTYAWHDHRIHWMSPEPPPAVTREDGEVTIYERWEVPVLVNDERVVVFGELVWIPDQAPVIPILVAVLVAVAAFAWLVRGGGRPDLVLAGAAVLTFLTALGGYLGAEVDKSAGTTGLVVGVAALVLAALSLGMRASRPKDARLLSILAGIASLGYAVQWLGALVEPQLPYAYPDVVTRVLLAGAIGLAVAGLVETVRRRPGAAATAEGRPAPPS